MVYREEHMKKCLSAFTAGIATSVCCLAMTSCSTGNNEKCLVMVTDADFPPFEYLDEEGGYVGLDIDIAEAIAEKIGAALKIESIPFDDILDEVESGKYDFGMAGLTVNEERKAQVMFSDTYATGIQSIIVKEDSEFNKLDDFFTDFDGSGNPTAVKTNVTIGVQRGTTGDTYASADPVEWGFEGKNVKKYDTGEEAVQALADGDLTAVIIDNEPAKAFVQKYSGLKVLETPYANESYAICVNKSNTELLGKINNALEELEKDGELERIVDKYIAK